MKNYLHLTLEEREKLFCLHEQGYSLRAIGKLLKRSDTTMGRELKRNQTGVGKRSNEYLTFRYLPCKAHRKALRRGQHQRHKAPLKDTFTWLYVREHLRPPYRWSPEQIAGRLTLEHPAKHITTETIYRYIYSKGAKRYRLWIHLALTRKKRMVAGGRSVRRASKIPGAVSIDLRPEVVLHRTEPGHWETDNVVGKQSDQSVLSVTVERVTRYTVISKLGRSAIAKSAALRRRMKKMPLHIRRTLTADNGAENTQHQLITQHLGLTVYFTHPYHSWEKGAVENMNGRLRRYIPKGVSLDTVTEKQVHAVEAYLNSTPRKCLGYLTPYEKMAQVLT